MKRLLMVVLALVLLAGAPPAEVSAWMGNGKQLDRMEEKIDKISGDTQNILDALGVIAEGTLPRGATLLGYADKVGWNPWVVAAHTGLVASELDNLPAGMVLKHPTTRQEMESAIKKGRELRKAYYAPRKPDIRVNKVVAQFVESDLHKTKRLEADLVTTPKLEATVVDSDLVKTRRLEAEVLVAEKSNVYGKGAKGGSSSGKTGAAYTPKAGVSYTPRAGAANCPDGNCPGTSSVRTAWTKTGEGTVGEYRVIYGKDGGAVDLVTVKYWTPGGEVQIGVCNWSGTKERLQELLGKALVKARELSENIASGKCSGCTVENCYMTVVW